MFGADSLCLSMPLLSILICCLLLITLNMTMTFFEMIMDFSWWRKIFTRNIRGINFTKKWFKVFRKSNFFLFSDREFYADQKCSGCLFSILSSYRVVKIFVILLKKKFFLDFFFFFWNYSTILISEFFIFICFLKFNLHFKVIIILY